MILKNNKSISQKIDKKHRRDRSTQNSLVLPSTYRKNPNFEFIKNNLVNSKLFSEISYQKLLTAKHRQTIKVNDVTCVIDGIDSPSIELEDLRTDKIFENVNFIFVLQFCAAKAEHYAYLSKKSGINILPLIYGTSGRFSIRQFNWRKTNHKYLAHFGFGVSVQKHRKKWIAKAKQNGNFLVSYTSGKIFAEALKDCKWGVSLKGSGVRHDGKCYREAEFLSCGMPLALDYQPSYSFPFLPNVHYLYLDSPSMLDDLDKIDPEPFAKRSKALWRNYYCPSTFTNLFLSILYDEDYRASIPNFWPGSKKTRSTIKLEKIRFKKNG